MAERGNYVGIDVMKPMAPTAEKQAELDAGVASDQASTLNFDLNTLEGARNAVRPAAVLFGLSALVALLTGILLTFQADWSQLTNTSLPAAEYTAANGRAYLALGLYVNAAWVGLLAVFVFLRSRVATFVNDPQHPREAIQSHVDANHHVPQGRCRALARRGRLSGCGAMRSASALIRHMNWAV